MCVRAYAHVLIYVTALLLFSSSYRSLLCSNLFFCCQSACEQFSVFTCERGEVGTAHCICLPENGGGAGRARGGECEKEGGGRERGGGRSEGKKL